MLTLSNLSPTPGSRKPRKRIGRGQGSGHGGTATKGAKGAKARSGGSVSPGFEGGQMPLQRRLPKRGFHNFFKIYYSIVALKDLDRFESGTTVNLVNLIEKGLAPKKASRIKILANGDITKALIVAVDKVSAVARQKIEAAGGRIEGI